jgi:hypothetical protein
MYHEIDLVQVTVLFELRVVFDLMDISEETLDYI